jgi:DNA/RNA-binding domain of Phe-tRNA-synthetase-like protein
MNWLLSALKPFLSWLVSFGLNKLASAIQHYIEEKEKARQREAALNKAKQEVIDASQADDITEEERIQRQKDAFKKLIDTVNSSK